MNDDQIYPATPHIPRINVAPSHTGYNIDIKAFLKKASDFFNSLSTDLDISHIPPSHALYFGTINREKSTIHGPGISTISSEKTLEGIFDSSINFGKECKISNHDTHATITGDYEGGIFNGLGEINIGSLTYKGTIKSDYVTGSGHLQTNDFTYTGEFNNEGKRHGFGDLVFENKKYIGNFVNDYPDGKGQLITDELETGINSVFEGNFIGGKQHGEGRLTDSDGHEWYVMWDHGVLQNKQPFHIKTIQDLTAKVEKLTEQCNNSSDVTCKVCMNEQANIATVPCGHLSMCQQCEQRMHHTQGKRCPICRTHYKSTVKIIIPT